MHSLFGGRKSSSNNLASSSSNAQLLDEFGALNESSNHTPPRPSSRAARDREKQTANRKRAISSGGGGGGPVSYSSADLSGAPPESVLGGYGYASGYPDGAFFPTIIPPKKQPVVGQAPDYGYLAAEVDITLGIPDVLRLVAVVDRELSSRGGLKEPFLFSSKALDVSAARVRSLVSAFVATCEPSNLSDYPGARRPDARDVHVANSRFEQEAGFAGPHELGMLLKWGLARIARVKNGYEVRGFLELDEYVVWRMEEQGKSLVPVKLVKGLNTDTHDPPLAARYPPNFFPTIYHLTPEPTHALLNTLLSLFSRFCANSSFSGLTPPALASHFGPLIFGLGPSSLPFGPTYKLYLRSCHATEHLLLAYIQNSDSELPLGVELPTKLKGWIHGYPNMLPRTPEDLENPRPNQRLVHVASVRRNVRLYSSDLVQNATTWCNQGDHTSRTDWKRIVPNASGEYSRPRYTDEYRKLLNLPKSFEPKAPYDGGLKLGSSPSTVSFHSPQPMYRNPIDDAIARSHPELSSSSTLSSTGTNEDKYKNLADMRWSQFSEVGFSNTDSSALQFDLGETARRNARNRSKRDTVNWNDFALAGFDRPAKRPPPPVHGAEAPLPFLPLDPLAEVLQFSVPLEKPEQWTEHSHELTKKLRKQQKSLPTFGWETGAVAGRDWVVEEGMIACWSELCLSSGWMDRLEGTFRESNWAMIEFKALPGDPSTTRFNTRDGSPDPRTSGQWILVEEFIPREYRDDLQTPKKKKNPLFASLNTKSKKWTSASTMNGQPYAGRPRSPNPKDYEFDAVLRNSGSTTRLTLGNAPPPPAAGPELTRVATPARAQTTPATTMFARPKVMRPSERPEPPPKVISAPLFVPPRTQFAEGPSPVTPTKSSDGHSAGSGGQGKLPAPLARLKRSRNGQPAEWDSSIEFEARTESDSDEERHGPAVPSKTAGHGRRLSKHDAWVDIVVLNPDEQTGLGHHPTAGGSDGHTTIIDDATASDPDRAQAEIDQALEGVRSATPDSYRRAGSIEDPEEAIRPPVRTSSRADSDEVGIQASITHRRDLPASKFRDDVPAAMSPAEAVAARALRVPLPASPYPPGRAPSPSGPPVPTGTSSPSGVRVLPVVPSTQSPPPPPRTTSVPSTPVRNGSGSGVSSLVHMYQTKEAAALATIPPALVPKSPNSPPQPQPSRLPISTSSPHPPGGGAAFVRSSPSTPGSLDTVPTQSMVGLPLSPQPTRAPSEGDTASVISEESTMEPLDPPPRLEPVRVPSPGRYVHGAPLTNVLEEEEEA